MSSTELAQNDVMSITAIIIIIIIYLYSVQLQPGASHRRFYDVKSNKNVFRSRLKADWVRS